MNILDQILLHKAEVELPDRRRRVPLSAMRRLASEAVEPRDFSSAICDSDGVVALIAEVKRASPSKGDLVAGEQFDPAVYARDYQAGGAHAISVLTDERFFRGHLSYVSLVKAAVGLPVLRKDFIIDEYQIHEARAAGADAVLLIVAALDDSMLADFSQCAQSLGLATLVEVHDEVESVRALKCGAEIIGINNRDLKTFTVDLETTGRCARVLINNVRHLKCIVSESGISTPEDVQLVGNFGAGAVLVGESLIISKQRIQDVMGISHVRKAQRD